MANTLDRYDKEIIKYLQEDASISNIDLSKKIGLAASSCLLRTKNLKEQGIITKFTTEVNEKKLGYGFSAFAKVVLQPCNSENAARFIAEATKIPQIIECYTITGDASFLLKIIAEDQTKYRDLVIDKIMSVSGVMNVETYMVMGVEKHTNCVPLE